MTIENLKGHKSIKDNIVMLQTYHYVEKECMRILGGWFAALPTIELKVQVGDDIYQDAEHGQWVYSRLSELPGGKRKFTHDVSWKKAIESAVQAAGYAETLAGIYFVLKKELVEGYRKLFLENHQIADAPTFVHLQRIMEEKQQQIKKMENVLAGYSSQDSLKKWIDFLGTCLEYPEQSLELPDGFGSVKVPADEAERNPEFTTIRKRDDLLSWCDEHASSKLDRVRYLRFSMFASEMQAAETLAAILYTWDQMPWEFYYDLSRHFWDELRHSQVGLKRMQEFGFEGKDFPWMVEVYRVRNKMSPFLAYAFVTLVQETGAMKGKQEGAKRFTELGDDISAILMEYDINDERTHVQLGHKWLKYAMDKANNKSSLDEVKEEATASFQAIMNPSENPKQKEMIKRDWGY